MRILDVDSRWANWASVGRFSQQIMKAESYNLSSLDENFLYIDL